MENFLVVLIVKVCGDGLSVDVNCFAEGMFAGAEDGLTFTAASDVSSLDELVVVDGCKLYFCFCALGICSLSDVREFISMFSRWPDRDVEVWVVGD